VGLRAGVYAAFALPRVMHRVSSFLVSLVDSWKVFALLRGLAFWHVMSFTKQDESSLYKLPKPLFNFSLISLFKRQTKEVGKLLSQLYLHGLALGDFELALRGLLGEGAPLSPASMLRLKTQWQTEYETWKQRRLDDLEVVYIWADGLYVKAGL
jgi:Transposase, Mutator family